MIRIYLDLDGVGADWTGYMLKNHFPQFKTIDTLNKHPNRQTLLEQVYLDDSSVFLNLEPLPQFKVLLDKLINLKKEFPISLKILTAIGSEHHNPLQVASDKRGWLRTHFNINDKDIIIVNRSNDKQYLSDPHSILIDDFDDNIVSWVKGGGHGVLVTSNNYCQESTFNQIYHKCVKLIS